MRPLTIPPPSSLPYLSSVEVGWDGLLAQAFHELPEMESYIVPGATHIGLSLITGGEMQLGIREVHARSSWEEVLLQSGDLLLGAGSNRSFEQRWRSTSPVPIYSFSLHFSRDLLVRTVEELAGGDASRLMLLDQAGFQDPFLQQLALSLWRELQEGAPSGKLFAECAAQLIMFHLVRTYSCSGAVAAIPEVAHSLSAPQLGRVTSYIREHANKELTLEVLAQQIGYSPYHFARLFRQTTGQTPHQWVQRERVAQARRLLESSTLSLAEVAAESGFGDQSYFTRVFRQALRVTPAAYRRECGR